MLKHLFLLCDLHSLLTVQLHLRQTSFDSAQRQSVLDCPASDTTLGVSYSCAVEAASGKVYYEDYAYKLATNGRKV